jgi:hypothetical protein
MMKKIFFFILILLHLFFSPLIAQDDQKEGQYRQEKNVNPMITEILEAISRDSIAAIMQSMVNMGTRFMYAENRRDVASWIAKKFKNYGYADVVLDSFKIAGETIQHDSVWQYNVVATFTGTSAPGEIYIISAHHDDYAEPDPHVMPVPGADDNASGCAVAMEIARVFKAKGFRPASTIRFITYAAEELTGYTSYSGSIYYADKVASKKEDIRLVICNDMVGYNKDSAYSIFGVDMPTGKNAWAGDLTFSSASMYTRLNMIPGEYPTSDAYRFWELGYCVSGFQEYGMNPWYHTNRDSVSNCKMDFCQEAVKANCAILLNEQLTPVPQELYYTSDKNSILVLWKPTLNANVQKFRIYRSETPDSAFTFVGQTEGPGFSYNDTTVLPGIIYYYHVCSIDHSGFESTPSNLLRSATAPKNRELLVVKDSKGGYNNPPETAVSAFYQRIFRDLPYDYSDASIADSLDLAILGKYQRIAWLSNAFPDQKNSSFRRHSDDISSYVQRGGQLFISGFQPSFLIMGNTLANNSFGSEDTIRKIYKIRQVERRPNALLNGAWPCLEEYDSLRIDSSKCTAQLAGHLMNVECIFPSGDGDVIYRFNSGFDSSSSQGSMKGKPVGIEYLGDDYKVILLSVPLYYLDSAEAKTLVELVVNEKFRSNVGIRVKGNGKKPACSIQSYPNPCNDQVTITYQVDRKSAVTIELVSAMGKSVIIRQEGIKENGSYTFKISLGQLPSGVYMLILRAGDFVCARKLIHVDL